MLFDIVSTRTVKEKFRITADSEKEAYAMFLSVVDAPDLEAMQRSFQRLLNCLCREPKMELVDSRTATEDKVIWYDDGFQLQIHNR